MSSVSQLFEELQQLLGQDPEDQSPAQAPGPRRRVGSRTQGEGPLGTGAVGGVQGPAVGVQRRGAVPSSECPKREVGRSRRAPASLWPLHPCATPELFPISEIQGSRLVLVHWARLPPLMFLGGDPLMGGQSVWKRF